MRAFSGKRYWLVGASEGLGLALARKLSAAGATLIFSARSAEALQEIYPRMAHCDADWQELREYLCPSCARQLEVEAVAPGYPVIHEFLPDLEGFYHSWLGREVPDANGSSVQTGARPPRRR